MKIVMIDTGVATCVYEPRGDHGLEGFQLNQTYKYAAMETATGKYYRIYPDTDFPGYYETCSKSAFNKYFEVIK